MNIITAEEAKEMSENYIPYELESSIEYVMKEIEDSAKFGYRDIDFNPNCCIHWDTIASTKFEAFMKKMWI